MQRKTNLNKLKKGSMTPRNLIRTKTNSQKPVSSYYYDTTPMNIYQIYQQNRKPIKVLRRNKFSKETKETKNTPKPPPISQVPRSVLRRRSLAAPCKSFEESWEIKCWTPDSPTHN